MIIVEREENLENTFNKINKYININKDREKYASCFETLKTKLFEILRKDEAFNRLFNGFQLGGSYGDNLKVNKPNEYDLVFYLRIPESLKIKITKDRKIPGNVFLDLTEVFKEISKHKHHNVIYMLLQKFVTSANVLMVDKLQNWLDSCFQKAVNELGSSIDSNGTILYFQKTRCGPAHTFWVRGSYTFSVDFVPAIKLDVIQSVLTRDLRNNHQWEVIPKPIKQNSQFGTTNGPNCSFRASYYTAENNIMSNYQNFKNALRFMKKFRDNHQNMSNLKSYYIKTLFLWKLKKENREYWRKPISIVVCEMFEELTKCLYKRELHFYWDPNLNMFKDYTDKQLNEMYYCVVNANKILKRASDGLTDHLRYQVRLLFMSRAERELENIVNPSAPSRSETTTTSTTTTATTSKQDESSCIVL